MIILSGCSSPYYKGAPSDHFDGKKFFAPEKIEKKNWLAVARWRFGDTRKSWPEWVELGQTDKPPSEIKGNDLRASYINHATVLLQTRGLNILTDPIWSKRASPLGFMGPKRHHVPGVAWDDLPKIDLVVISHSHYDHLDLATVKRLTARDNPLFVVPLGVDAIIRRKIPHARLHAMDWGQSHVFNPELTLHAEPVQHWSARTPFDDNEALWASYVLSFGGENIYFSGDTGYASGQIFRDIGQKYGEFRFAMLAVGAYEPRWFMKESHINPAEAVQVYKDIHANHAMPLHWGTFQLTDEGRDEPIEALKAALDQQDISHKAFNVLLPGEAWMVPLTAPNSLSTEE